MRKSDRVGTDMRRDINRLVAAHKKFPWKWRKTTAVSGIDGGNAYDGELLKCLRVDLVGVGASVGIFFLVVLSAVF